jgi:hypothetical protein
MTVVIATIYDKGNTESSGCVIIADKMLSYGDIAVETDGSKLHKLVDLPGLKAVMGAAGDAELIEDFSQRLQEKIEDTLSSGARKGQIETVRDVVKLGVRTLNEMVKENVESFLVPYGKTLNDVFKQNVPSDLLTFVGRTIEDNRKALYRELEVLIAGVDTYGAHIFKIEDGDYVPTDSIGYEAIGSGFESSNWTLMHQSYDSRGDLPYALFMSAYAKVNAEESFGVGMRTDGYVLERKGISELKDDEIDLLRSKIDEMIGKEKNMKNEYVTQFKKVYKEVRS